MSGIEYDGALMQKDQFHEAKKLKARIADLQAQLAAAGSVNAQLEGQIIKLNEKIEELKVSNKHYKDRLSTALQKVRGGA